tara:strand:- start:47 stop:316 length:270 start_codon:yes stop_codon:yes gene_type:complete
VAPHWRTVLLKFGIITAPLREELQGGNGSAPTFSEAARACVEITKKVETKTIVVFISLLILISPNSGNEFSLYYNGIVSSNFIKQFVFH